MPKRGTMCFSRETIPIVSGSPCMEEIILIMRHVCDSRVVHYYITTVIAYYFPLKLNTVNSTHMLSFL